jgi:predicted short-subunit dehydrogenase-like oxidoreductase (DUF2520 family)
VENSLTPRRTLPITIIGAGAVGYALALSLHKKQYFIRAVFSKTGKSAKLLGKKVGASQSGILSTQDRNNGVFFIAVPDDEIKNVVRRLIHHQSDFSGSLVFHTSGALSSDVLLPLKKKGAAVGSFHPLQTFPRSKIGSVNLREIFVAVEGDRKAVAAGKRIARGIEARPFVLSSQQKVLYHIAAVFGSNYFVTLLSVVEELGLRIGVPQRKIISMIKPLILQSLNNVRTQSASSALTGPIARGDARTINKHRSALKTKKLRHISELYTALAKATTRLASKKKT